MQTHFPRHSRCGSRDGVALLAVLACILLLTILIVSYISFTKLNHISTAEYGNSVQAQEIAQGGLQDIVTDLHQEIVAGSSASTNAATFVVSGTPVYVPTVNLTAVPARVGYAASAWGTDTTSSTFAPSLVRVSRRAASASAPIINPQPIYYPGTLPLNRASAASTATASTNGRTISANRWNKTLLLSPYPSTSASFPSPFTASASATTGPPDWVYVTRTGSRVCQASELATSPGLKASSNLTQNYGTITPGSNPPVSPVVGRYAFVMYDEGALLDANVAGSPSTLVKNGTVIASNSPVTITTSTADPVSGRTLDFAGKSYQYCADLYQLPGLNTAAGQTQIDNLIALRNAGAMNGAAAPVAGNTYLGALFQYASYGFSSFVNNGAASPVDDAPFLSRQDLINYFAKIDSGLGTSSATYSLALPYLGTFSRAVSAPTYIPPSDASSLGGSNGTGNIYAYKDNAENPNGLTGVVANRDLANVRFGNAGSVTHYFDSQTGTSTPTGTATYTVKVGDPLLQNRFSLAKINWLSQANPANGSFANSAAYAAPIQACFGLVWGYPGGSSTTVANGGNQCWNYDGPTGNSPVNTIETLDQVAAESPPREPNFFELLKAAILSGSLGINTGRASFDNGKLDIGFAAPDYANNNGTYGSPNAGGDNLYSYTMDGHVTGQNGTVPAPSQITDLQIMQIGANIIDQYDADNYPTAIYFQAPAYSASNYDAASSGYLGEFGPTDMVFGDENLPELNAVLEPTCTTDGSQPNDLATPPTTGPLGAWWQPEIWNPHQAPASTNPSSPATMQYVIRAYGNSKHFNTTSSTSSPVTPLDGQSIYFTDTNPTTSAFYSHPYLLTQNTIPGVTSNTASTAAGVTAASMMATTVMADEASNPFVGFSMGVDPAYTADPNPNSGGHISNYIGQGEPVASFALGWSSTGTDFHPYSFITGIFAYTYGKDQFADHGTAGSCDPIQITSELHRMIDPRIRNIPTYAGWLGTENSDLWPNNTFTTHPSVEGGWGNPAASIFNYAAALIAAPEDWMVNQASPLAQTKATSTYYSDPDGVIRPGDGVYGNATYGDGIMLFLSAGTNGTGALGDRQTGSGGDSNPASSAGNNSGNIRHARRPIILNRPFRSVGELGYTSRALPFKTLDFFTSLSADAGLLDVFSLTDESQVSSNSQLSSVIAGQVDLSNAPAPVLEALIVGGSKKDLDPTYNFTSVSYDGPNIAQNICALLQPGGASGPLLNRAGLVTQMQSQLQYITGTTLHDASRTFGTVSYDKYDKAYLEAPVRALGSVTNTRTWNLMIDIIAQSGEFSPTAQPGDPNALSEFIVQGEKRYWLHIAIDRYTGKIVAQQLEPVYE